MNYVTPGAALAALLAAAQMGMPLSAAQSDDAIIVEGQRVDIPKLVKGTINDVGVTPLARFEDKICPGVVGVAGEQAIKLLQMVQN